MNGKVVNVVDKKFYGFIKGEDGKQYFFHSSGFGRRFTPGEFDALLNCEVEFEPTVGEAGKGPRAENIGITSVGML